MLLCSDDSAKYSGKQPQRGTEEFKLVVSCLPVVCDETTNSSLQRSSALINAHFTENQDLLTQTCVPACLHVCIGGQPTGNTLLSTTSVCMCVRVRVCESGKKELTRRECFPFLNILSCLPKHTRLSGHAEKKK